MTMSTPLAFASLKLASVCSWKGSTGLPSGIEIAILCMARLMSWMNRLIASSASSITVMLGPVYISPRTSARSPLPALATMSFARWCAMSFPNAFFDSLVWISQNLPLATVTSLPLARVAATFTRRSSDPFSLLDVRIPRLFAGKL